MDIEYELDIDDVVTWNLYYYDHSPQAKKNRQTTIIIMIAVALIFLLIGIKFITNNEIVLAILLFYLALLPLCIAIFIKSSNKKDITKQIAKLYSEGKNGIIGKNHVSIKPECIEWNDEDSTGTTAWDVIEDVVTTDQHIFIIRRPTSYREKLLRMMPLSPCSLRRLKSITRRQKQTPKPLELPLPHLPEILRFTQNDRAKSPSYPFLRRTQVMLYERGTSIRQRRWTGAAWIPAFAGMTTFVRDSHGRPYRIGTPSE
jgi:hypothetical protein